MAELLKPLIDAARSGDRDALNQLAQCADRFVRIFSGSLSHHLRKTCGSTIDFVLEGLAEALAHLSDFEYRSDAQFYEWVACYIRNRILNAARDEGRQKRAGRSVALGEDDQLVAGPDLTASSIVSAQEVRTAAGRAIVDLQLDHPEEMEAVVLKVYEGQSWPGIRQTMRLTSDKRARTLFARGIDLLRPQVEKTLGDVAFAEFLGL
jgi:DNA-directed RNA polymerase specialized sigma24 family protein